MSHTIARIAVLVLAGALVGCEHAPPTYIRPAAITGTFVLRSVEGKPLPVSLLPLTGFPDGKLVADTLKLFADFSFQQFTRIEYDLPPGIAPNPTTTALSFFTQRGDVVDLFGLGVGRVAADSLFLLTADLRSPVVYERRTYSRTAP